MTAVVLRTFDAIELERLLRSDARLRAACQFTQLPHRKTIARRLATLVPEAEEQVACLGSQIKEAVEHHSISAIDGRMYEALGAKWHTKDRAQGTIPTGLRNVDTESYWSKSARSRLSYKATDW